MAGSSSASPAPKILLAKPGLVTAGPGVGKFGRPGSEDETVTHHRSRLPAIGSLNLLSDSWEFHIDRFLPFLTENTDFTVVGVIGPPGVGKSTIMNELYGFDATSPGMLPPFTTQSEDNRAMARHSSVGIEPRVSADRLILLDTQPVFSSSILAEMMRPDGSSTISVLSGENLSAELAHELMGIQVDLLKHGIPDPSSLTSSHLHSSNVGPEKENKDKSFDSEGYMATPVFVHTKFQGQNFTPLNLMQLRKALAQYFSSSSFMREKCGNLGKENLISSTVSTTKSNDLHSTPLSLILIPSKNKDDMPRAQHESYISALWKLRDEVLSMNCPSFARTVSERDWLKNSAKIWELVKNSSIIAEYSRTLQNSGMFRR
ncbi:nonsense-mediated mRNA decay factor SMG9 isoform X2 [Ricinus communis]|uniref:nonsense-mediated mRNA decay factor SMG9 isoform X2 n=1 Tax=Ricinus communis TaxID=3988 RepID=UPI00201AB63D|nr:nonsense-mediated mRNA decay factor SMG9 isoform X2 [Ricinus communis]